MSGRTCRARFLETATLVAAGMRMHKESTGPCGRLTLSLTGGKQGRPTSATTTSLFRGVFNLGKGPKKSFTKPGGGGSVTIVIKNKTVFLGSKKGSKID